MERVDSLSLLGLTGGEIEEGDSRRARMRGSAGNRALSHCMGKKGALLRQARTDSGSRPCQSPYAPKGGWRRVALRCVEKPAMNERQKYAFTGLPTATPLQDSALLSGRATPPLIESLRCAADPLPPAGTSVPLGANPARNGSRAKARKGIRDTVAPASAAGRKGGVIRAGPPTAP